MVVNESESNCALTGKCVSVPVLPEHHGLCIRSSSSSCRDRKSCRSSDQVVCSPEPRQGKSSPCRPFCSAADEPFYQMEDEQQVHICAFACSNEYSMFQ